MYKGMNHMELQTILGEAIRGIIDEKNTVEEREIALENGRAVNSIAKQMINNGRFILDAEKLEATIGSLTHSKATDLIGE